MHHDPPPTLNQRPPGKPVFRLAGLAAVLIVVVVGAIALIISQLLLTPPTLPGAEVYIERGEALLEEGLYAEAITQFGFAIDANPQSIPAHLARAEAFLLVDDYERALQDLERIRALTGTTPDNVVPLLATARAGATATP